MQKRHLVGLMLSATLGLTVLAGCNVPNPALDGSSNAPTNTGTSGNNAALTINTDTSASLSPVNQQAPVAAANPGVTTADALNVAATEQEMEGYNAAAAEADPAISAYAVQDVVASNQAAANATATSTVAAPASPLPAASAAPVHQMNPAQRAKLRARQAAVHARQEKHLRANEKDAVRNLIASVPWNKDANGTTETKQATLTFSRTDNKGHTYTRSLSVLRTINIVGHELVHAKNTVNETFYAGGTHAVSWEKTLNADGSYSIVFSQDRKYANGPERTALWNKTEDTNGNLSGTGTITWLDKTGKQVASETISFGGSDVSGATVAPVGTASGTLPLVVDSTATATTTAPSAGATATGSATVTTGTGVSAGAAATGTVSAS